MRSGFKCMMLLGVMLTLLLSCSEDGTKMRDNEFDNGALGEFIKVSYSSNADSLFLAWELTDKMVSFDYYNVSDSRSNMVVRVDKSATSCLITHLPYDELVTVSIVLVKNDVAVKTSKTSLRIDGLDKEIAKIIIPDRNSVTGGDGMYSIPLPDGRSIFLMGDSYTGPVTNNQRSQSDHMYRNTYILYDNGTVSAICDAKGKGSSAAVPPGHDHEDKWYWPGHGFTQGNKLYVFQTLMYNGEDGMWGFRYEKTDILEYDLPAVTLSKTTEVPFKSPAEVQYGMAALNNGDYIYVYAQVNIDNSYLNPLSDAVVARTTVDNLYGKWEFYTGSSWSDDPNAAVKMAGLSSVPISSQFNVFKLRDKYVLISQRKQFGAGEIYTFVSDTPYGPWGKKRHIFTSYEQKTPNLFTYNAMAHPQFERDAMILVSYNVNTEVFSQQSSDVSTYRPRFFWVSIDTILNN